MEIKEEDVGDLKHNPWTVGNLDDFLYYCCPECDNRTQSKQCFINHAYLNHPKVSKTYYPIKSINLLSDHFLQGSPDPRMGIV